LAAEALLDGEAEAITRKAIDQAKAGYPWAVRICLERVLPSRKDRPIKYQLPAIETPADATKASAALFDSVANGDLTPSEASEMGKLIDSYIRSIEVHDFEQRLARLEQSNGSA
jgi:hypothetical protein